ncbi:MAG: ScyD/ScyE family protein [Chloroflexota bacterium]|nr:MAG: ScyD/ScyE family protein [Chloroflexota bacterium]
MHQGVRQSAIVFVLFAALLSACQEATGQPKVRVVAEGLINPLGLAVLPDGSLLVAEEGTGEKDDSAGVSLIRPDGQGGRLISGLYSSRDSGDLSGAPLVAVSPAGDALYVGNFDAGHLWMLPLSPGEALTVPAVPLTSHDLSPAMEPLRRVQLVNPFDMTFDQNGIVVVSDASANGVAKENPDGTTRFFHQFAGIPDPTNEKLSVDPVPTGITRVGSEYYVTLTGGCPFPEGAGRLVAVDETRNERDVLSGLNMPIDVAQGEDGTIWLLEFGRFSPDASCFSGEGYLPNTGRLSRLRDDGLLEPVLTELNFPGAVLPVPGGSIYISEVFSGRILHLDGVDDSSDLPISVSDLVSDADTLVMPFVPRATRTPAPRPTSASETATEWRFEDVAAEIGLDFRHGAFQTGLFPDPVAMMGAGLCWLDYDGDDWLDLYLINSHAVDEVNYFEGQGSLPRNALYRNEGGFFREVSEESHTSLSMRGNGCVAADFDLDGWSDIYVTADGPNYLLWNNGDGTFSEGAVAAGVDAADWNSAAAVGDLNGDGWPDLFVGSYIDLEHQIPKPSGAFPQDFYGLPDYLYLNNGPDPATGKPTFRETALAAGLEREERTLGAALTDLDRDGDLDLYIANDGHPNRLYENRPWPDGLEEDPLGLGFRFEDLTESADVGDSGSGMGVAVGDYDGDSFLDLFTTNWDVELHALYRNQMAENNQLNFRYSTYRIGISGLGRNNTGWGTAWGDLDHDTDLDLLVVNGRVPITDLASDPEPVRLFGNRLVEGHPGQFREWTEQVGLEKVGPLMARGSALADFDNDGDLDLAINTIAGPAVLLRNIGTAGNWLEVTLNGFHPGARATVTLPDGSKIVREWLAGSSYLASEDPRLHFGLGEVDVVPELTVRWPAGETLSLQDVPANQHLMLARPDNP